MQWIGSGFEAINRWQFVNDLTWTKSKHTIKIGYEYRLHQFNFHGWAASTGGTFNFNRLGTGGYDAAGNSHRRDGRSVRVIPAGPGADGELPDSGVHHMERRLSRRLISTTISR